MPVLNLRVLYVTLLKCFIILAKPLSRTELRELLAPLLEKGNQGVFAAFDVSVCGGICKGLPATQENGAFDI